MGTGSRRSSWSIGPGRRAAAAIAVSEAAIRRTARRPSLERAVVPALTAPLLRGRPRTPRVSIRRGVARPPPVKLRELTPRPTGGGTRGLGGARVPSVARPSTPSSPRSTTGAPAAAPRPHGRRAEAPLGRTRDTPARRGGPGRAPSGARSPGDEPPISDARAGGAAVPITAIIPPSDPHAAAMTAGTPGAVQVGPRPRMPLPGPGHPPSFRGARMVTGPQTDLVRRKTAPTPKASTRAGTF